MVFGIAGSVDRPQIRPHRFQGGFDKLQSVVDEVRSPVVELTAAEAGQGLPVKASLERVTAEFDKVNITQLAGGDDLADVLESRFQTAVLAAEKFSRMLLGSLFQFQHFSIIDTDGLFGKDEFSAFESLDDMGNVVR